MFPPLIRAAVPPRQPAMMSTSAVATAALPRADDVAASLLALTTALDERDRYTNLHCDRVCRMAVALGQACGMDSDALDTLAMAARFHDIGKIGIPDAILRKPGRLEPEEMAVMRTHPLRGERVFLATGRADAPDVARIIRQHHEAWDGSGYPDGLQGEQIPLGARVLAVIDGYDAMITDRPYRAGMPMDKTLATLQHEAGTRLDPAVVETFVQLHADGKIC